ncbi:cytoplasmic dynein 1 intermediate chain 1 isoform X4 [Ranitomeya variabilis]|uniref:cytoplasmic dynein 1 intermediate chain 1 isoform X4 n=1 Tax=Ranitomeya variabilis TaxID=490064 RepID=UPI004056D2A6
MPPKRKVSKEKKDPKKPDNTSAAASSSQEKTSRTVRAAPSKGLGRRLKEEVAESAPVTRAAEKVLPPGKLQESIMSDKSDLKAELERKKQRLAQIREEKKRKEEERKKKETEQQQKTEPIHEDTDLDRKRRETEALLQSIGISPEPSLVPTPMSPSSKSLSTPSEAGSQDSVDGAIMGRNIPSGLTGTLQWDTDPSVLQLHSESELGRRMIKLGVSKVTQVDFLPREVVSYAKETQTPVTTLQAEEEEEDEEMVEHKTDHDSEFENQEEKQDSREVPPRELTEEEKQQAVHSEEFLIFFDRTIRVIERALAEDCNIFFDYSGRDLADKEGDIQAGANLSFNRQFYDEHWSKHRVVTCLDWSLQSSVMSVCFARFHPNLVIGGTYSGQIVLWDNRSHRRTPVQRTPLSAAAHTHPIYCVNVVGTQNAHNLITVSTDGKLCSWSLDMLSAPQESMELVYNKSKSVAVTGMAFPTGDVNNFVVGSEEGTVYAACRHGSKAGISEVFEGHQGPITGLNCHSAVGAIDFSHLFLTSSFDWTVKLWTTKHNKPLYSFEDNADYVYDVMWSPLHPAIFACVDGMGRLDLWNLNSDTEVPTASTTVEGASALNRVHWAQSGREVAVGDSEGRIWIYDVGEFAVPHSDEWGRLARTLVEIRANRGDGEEEAVELSS